jgi:hypothetical protein
MFLIEHFFREIVKFCQFFRIILLQIHLRSETIFPDPYPGLDPAESFSVPTGSGSQHCGSLYLYNEHGHASVK